MDPELKMHMVTYFRSLDRLAAAMDKAIDKIDPAFRREYEQFASRHAALREFGVIENIIDGLIES